MKAPLRVLPFILTLILSAATPPRAFKVIDAGIHQTEDGPLVEKGTTFVPGEVIFFSCRLDGYQVSAAQRVAIQYQFSAVDPAGVPVVEPASGKIDTELALEDKEWRPKIRQTVLVPPLAESGIYKMRFSAKYELSGAVSSTEATFEVHGNPVEPSATLVVRNFRFYRTEDDAEPLKLAAYRPGDTIWAHFDITGYQLGAGNQRDVAYTLSVTGPGGRVLLAPREPTVDKGSSFYPMKYVPCVISLNLQPNIRADEYTIAIAAQDRIGNQTYESKQAFRVESIDRQ
jgi:hypothetical protein